jgi:inner membrane protein
MNLSSLRDSVMVRMIIVAVLGIVLQVPISLVSHLIWDRQRTREVAVGEVTEKWGRPQTIIGPILTVPIKRSAKSNDGGVRTYTEQAHFLPDTLALNAELTPEVRYRGIYRVVLYNTQLTIEADFPSPQSHDDVVGDGEILWKEAFVTIGISDLKGIRTISSATCGDRLLTPDPGLRTKDLVPAGFTLRTPLSPGENSIRLALDTSINGSEELRIVPLGKQTRLSAHSSWGDPSFTGDFLPEKREITDSAFRASWNVLHLNRNLPQAWTGPQTHLGDASFGVKLLLPVDEYQKNSRAVKYAIMFISLTFLAFAMIDVLSDSPFHPIHYTLIGLALILFFVMLLSLSEHLSFNISYLLASAPVIIIISMYTRGITRQWRVTAVVAGVLASLYGFLFVLLQLEDYSLLLGSLGLFAGLALVMFLTRSVDWFGVARPKRAEPECMFVPESLGQ